MATLLLGSLAGGAAAGGTSGIANAAMIAGTVLSGAGALQAGAAQKSASNYQAAQIEAAGKTEQAVAQRRAEEVERQTWIKQSRARAVGAAGGGGLDFELMGDIEEEGEYSRLTALWEGEEAAKGRQAQADAARFEGKQAKRASTLNAGKTILGGAASFYEKYG